jgi:hypothetical protein
VLSFLLTSIFISMSQNLTSIPAFDGMNYGYWKARMRFFLKSIDCWKTIETGWTELTDTNIELANERNAKLSMIKPFMHYVKYFHRLNLLKFQTVELLKKYGKS